MFWQDVHAFPFGASSNQLCFQVSIRKCIKLWNHLLVIHLGHDIDIHAHTSLKDPLMDNCRIHNETKFATPIICLSLEAFHICLADFLTDSFTGFAIFLLAALFFNRGLHFVSFKLFLITESKCYYEIWILNIGCSEMIQIWMTFLGIVCALIWLFPQARVTPADSSISCLQA